MASGPAAMNGKNKEQSTRGSCQMDQPSNITFNLHCPMVGSNVDGTWFKSYIDQEDFGLCLVLLDNKICIRIELNSTIFF